MIILLFLLLIRCLKGLSITLTTILLMVIRGTKFPQYRRSGEDYIHLLYGTFACMRILFGLWKGHTTFHRYMMSIFDKITYFGWYKYHRSSQVKKKLGGFFEERPYKGFGLLPINNHQLRKFNQRLETSRS